VFAHGRRSRELAIIGVEGSDHVGDKNPATLTFFD
jgi:hypothetical protein